MVRLCRLAVVLCLIVPAIGRAQPPAPASDLASVLHVADRVRLVDADGHTWEGRVTQIGPERLDIARRGRSTAFRLTDVREVAVVGDGLKNGALYGFAAGAAIGVALGGAFSGEFRAADALQGALFAGGLGLGIGVGIDAMNSGERVVFRRGPIALVPTVGRGGLGLTARVAW